MAWTQTDTGTWRKEIGGLQKTYRILSTQFKDYGCEHWGLYSVSTVEISPHQDAPNALRAAWKLLMVEFPGLGLTLDGYDAVWCAPTDEAAIDHWSQQTFAVEQYKSPNDIIASYPLRDLPALVYFPKTAEVLLLASHWRVDATGCLVLLDRLFTLVSQVPPDNVGLQVPVDVPALVAKLSPSLEDAAGSPEIVTPEIDAKTKEMLGNLREQSQKFINLSGAQQCGAEKGLGRAVSESVTLTEKSTVAFLKACKHLDISVSAAVYTALSRALVTLAAPERDKEEDEFASVVAVNMRSYLPSPYDDPTAHACQAYVSSIRPTIRLADRFSVSALDLTRHFQTWHTPDFNKCLRHGYKLTADAMQNQVAARVGNQHADLGPSDVTLSNLGVVEKYLKGGAYGSGDGCVRVGKFRFGVSMLNRQLLLYSWTFGGVLHLSINYNDAYYDACTPRGVLNLLLATLGQELSFEVETA